MLPKRVQLFLTFVTFAETFELFFVGFSHVPHLCDEIFTPRGNHGVVFTHRHAIHSHLMGIRETLHQVRTHFYLNTIKYNNSHYNQFSHHFSILKYFFKHLLVGFVFGPHHKVPLQTKFRLNLNRLTK